MTGMSDTPEAWLDARAARRGFERAAVSSATVDVLAREIEQRMAERLDLVRVEPRRILDVGCGAGPSRMHLAKRYPKAVVVGVDSAWEMLRQAAGQSLVARVRRLLARQPPRNVCADFGALPFPLGSFSMAWSNLALAWAPDPMRVFGELHRVLSPGGLLMFSSYGPDTLKELRTAFEEVDSHPHTHRFLDMHDLGDMLVGSGFVAPVMDMELVTLTFRDFDALARDLRLSGQSNAARGRRRGLLGKGAYARMRAAYESARRDGQLPATVEVIYGHAWRGEPRLTRDGRNVIKLDTASRRRSAA